MDYRNIFISCRKDAGDKLGEALTATLRKRRYTVYCGAAIENIADTTDFLLILTPDCMCNINKESDWLRMQVETAFKEQKNIVPILADGFQFPAELPPSIEPLRNRRSIRATGETLSITMDNLCNNYLESEPRKNYTKLIVILAILLALLLGLFLFRDPLIALIIPRATVSGVVTDVQTGEPIGGVLVTAEDKTTETGEDGAYQLIVKPGDHTFVYTHEGYEDKSVAYALERNAEEDGSVAISDGKGYVTGTVTQKLDGAPVAGAIVRCGNESATTDASGAYSLYLEKGERTLTVSAEGYLDANETVQVEADTTGTKDLVLSTGKAHVYGRLTSASSGQAIAGANVCYGSASTTTDANGEYSLELEGGEYALSASADRHMAMSETVQIEADTYFEKNISLASSEGAITGTVINAVTGDALVGVHVTCGAMSATTDASGTYRLTVEGGSYTLEFSLDGFISKSEEIEVRNGHDSTCDIALSPELENDQYRVVLTWGSRPRDLDSHLVWVNDHVFYSHKTGISSDAQLDLDDTDAYGPETTTFKMLPGQTYVFYVLDFSNRSNRNSTALSESGAKVEVYCGNTLLNTCTVPTSGAGNYWRVFTLRDGHITYGNTIQSTEPTLND